MSSGFLVSTISGKITFVVQHTHWYNSDNDVSLLSADHVSSFFTQPKLHLFSYTMIVSWGAPQPRFIHHDLETGPLLFSQLHANSTQCPIWSWSYCQSEFLKHMKFFQTRSANPWFTLLRYIPPTHRFRLTCWINSLTTSSFALFPYIFIEHLFCEQRQAT